MMHTHTHAHMHTQVMKPQVALSLGELSGMRFLLFVRFISVLGEAVLVARTSRLVFIYRFPTQYVSAEVARRALGPRSRSLARQQHGSTSTCHLPRMKDAEGAKIYEHC